MSVVFNKYILLAIVLYRERERETKRDDGKRRIMSGSKQQLCANCSPGLSLWIFQNCCTAKNYPNLTADAQPLLALFPKRRDEAYLLALESANII